MVIDHATHRRELKMTALEETPPRGLTREVIKNNPNILVEVYRTGNFGIKLGRVFIPKYKRWSVANLVLSVLFVLATGEVEGLLYQGMPQQWVRTKCISSRICIWKL